MEQAGAFPSAPRKHDGPRPGSSVAWITPLSARLGSIRENCQNSVAPCPVSAARMKHDRLFSPRESHTIPSYNLADRLADRAEAIWAARKQKLDGQRPAASQVREGGICTVAVLRGALRRPGRRIGQRGDATRAPTQEPRPERAARCRPVFPFRDWYETGKSTSLNPENSISR